MDLHRIYIEVPSNVSPPSGIVWLPILSDHSVSKLIKHLFIGEPLDIMAESKILTQV